MHDAQVCGSDCESVETMLTLLASSGFELVEGMTLCVMLDLRPSLSSWKGNRVLHAQLHVDLHRKKLKLKGMLSTAKCPLPRWRRTLVSLAIIVYVCMGGVFSGRKGAWIQRYSERTTDCSHYEFLSPPQFAIDKNRADCCKFVLKMRRGPLPESSPSAALNPFLVNTLMLVTVRVAKPRLLHHISRRRMSWLACWC